MKVSELIPLIQAEYMTPTVSTDKEITCGYTCDLLSWVMAHGDEGMAWVTVQTHMNVVAVAMLSEMACVILPENIDMDDDSLEKAAESMIPKKGTPYHTIATIMHIMASFSDAKKETLWFISPMRKRRSFIGPYSALKSHLKEKPITRPPIQQY